MMKSKKWLTVGLAVTMLSTVGLVGCGTTDTSTGTDTNKTTMDAKQELNLYLTDEIPTMDLSQATNNISFTVFANINEGLVRLDNNGKAQPALAKEWKRSDDGLTYTFTMRDGVKWSNGDPVTAHDFEYSWKRTLDPKTGSQYAFMVAWIKGGLAYNTNKGTVDQVGVHAKDDKTLEVTLENPIPFFVEQMAFPIFFAQNEKFVKAQGDKYGAEADKVLFNGPFKMTAWTHEQSAVLEKNDTYWDKDQVKLQKINFQVVKDTTALLNLYESGQVDRASLVRDFVDTYKGNKEFSTQPELTNIYVQYNQRVKAFTNAKVRQALTWAIDGDAYADIIYHNGSKGAGGYVPDGVSDGQGGDFRKNVGDLIQHKENVAKAKDTLKAGLAELGMTDFPKISLLGDDGDIGKKAAEFIQEQWRTNLGINIDVENVPYKLRLDRSHKHDFDAVISLWGADYNDPMTFLDMFITDGDFNDPKWSNPDYDKLVHAAQKEIDPKKRMQSLVDAEKLLMKEMPIGPIMFRGRAYLTKQYVKDFQWRIFGPDYELKTTYIAGKN